MSGFIVEMLERRRFYGNGICEIFLVGWLVVLSRIKYPKTIRTIEDYYSIFLYTSNHGIICSGQSRKSPENWLQGLFPFILETNPNRSSHDSLYSYDLSVCADSKSLMGGPTLECHISSKFYAH